MRLLPMSDHPAEVAERLDDMENESTGTDAWEVVPAILLVRLSLSTRMLTHGGSLLKLSRDRQGVG
jgi:hypothetical protein